MKFLVVGCNGMAGHIISIYLKENGNCVEGYARSSSPYIDTVIGDVNNVELLKKQLSMVIMIQLLIVWVC